MRDVSSFVSAFNDSRYVDCVVEKLSIRLHNTGNNFNSSVLILIASDDVYNMLFTFTDINRIF